jgi:predicted MFS family arabinose efflux permease
MSDSGNRQAYVLVAAGTAALAAGMGIGRFAYTPILPSMMSQIGLSASEAGLIASGNFAGYLLGALFAGGAWAAGRERSLVALALAASALLLAAMAASSGIAWLIAVRFLAGITSAIAMIFATTVINQRLSVLARPDLHNMHFLGVGIGIVASSLIVGETVGDGSAWQAPWLWCAAFGVVGAVIAALLLGRDSGNRTLATREGPLRPSLPLTLIVLSYGLFGLGYIVTATFLIAIVRSAGGGDLETQVWLATGTAGLFSIYIWGRVTKLVGARWAYACACFTLAAGVIVSVSLSSAPALIIAGMLFGGTFVAMTALGLQIGLRLAPAAPRRVLAVMTAAFGLGQIVGPVIAGYLADLTGSFTLPSLAAGAVLILGGVLALIAGRE